MKKYIQLVYRSFFNLSANKEFIKNGKGSGAALLCLVAFLFTVIYTIKPVVYMSAINKEEIKTNIMESFSRMPEVVIAQGQLQWQDNVVQRFDMGNGLAVTVDTVNASPSINHIKSANIYMTKDALYVNNGNKIQDVSFHDIQSLVGEDPFVLTSEKTVSTIMEVATHILWSFIAISIVIGFFALWLLYSFLAILARVTATKGSNKFKHMEADSLRRMSAISVTPAIITLSLVKYFHLIASFWVWFIGIVAVGVVLMHKYISHPDTKALPKAVAKKEVEKVVKVEAKKETAPKAPAPKAKSPAKKASSKPKAKAEVKKAETKPAPKKTSAAKPKAKAPVKAAAKKTPAKPKAKATK